MFQEVILLKILTQRFLVRIISSENNNAFIKLSQDICVCSDWTFAWGLVIEVAALERRKRNFTFYAKLPAISANTQRILFIEIDSIFPRL